jgi:hypothetical protein
MGSAVTTAVQHEQYVVLNQCNAAAPEFTVNGLVHMGAAQTNSK